MDLAYIVYRLQPSVARPGKTDKVPLDHRDGRGANPLDPAVWTDLTTAGAAAARLGAGHGVGLVVRPGQWFLDLDNCLQPDNTWSSLAVQMCQALAGCYVEVSASGRGLHIIGRGVLPAHGTRNGALGMELYSSGRFCALTGTHAQGSLDAESPVIGAIAATYFPPLVSPETPVEWTTGPCEGWAGPADDETLVRRMLVAQSAAAAFGGKASLQHLWEGDEDALGRAFPDSGGRAFDASAADAALAQHLAFWTGKDCERIERLMRASGLSRDKYDRQDYMFATITRACALQGPVLSGRPPVVATADPSGAVAATPGAMPGLIIASDYPRHFEGCVYIEDRYAAAVPDGSILSPQQFRASGRYGGHRFMLDDQKVTRNAWEAFSEAEVWQAPFAHTLCFRPELPPRSIISDAGRLLYNSYVPIQTRVVDGDPEPFLRHLRLLFPVERDRQWLLAWMARAVQSPGVKLQWAPLIQGCEGNGKTFLSHVMIHCIGERYCHTANAQDFSNKFNGWMEGKLFCALEEIYTSDRRDVLDALKVMITNSRVEIQAKGQNQVTGDNRVNFMLFTNHKDAISKTQNDRRYGMFFTDQQEAADLARCGMGGAYFHTLYAWLRADGGAIINGFLRAYQIPAEMDPAGLAHRSPQTSSTAAAIVESMGPAEQAILEAVGSEETGFRGGWVSSHWLDEMLKRRNLRNRCPPNSWDRMMQTLGYVKHPALAGGRVNNPVTPDGTKPRLWVLKDSIPALNLSSPAAVAAAYTKANSDLAATAATGRQA